jgi:hypothetical protein
MAFCKYCNKEVTWMQEGRKKVPVENDGVTHDCENFRRSRESIKVIDPSDIDPEILKQYTDAFKKKK